MQLTNSNINQSDQIQKKFAIPKGYKGIRSNITLQLNSNLGVITGLNGSGKTTLLKYIYEQYLDRKKIFFKTQKAEYFENERSYRRTVSRYRNTSENPTFDEKYDQIIELFKKNNRQPYTHHHEIFSMLFDESSMLYDQGYFFLEKLAEDILSDFDKPQNIKQRLGVPTIELIEREVIKEINREIQNSEFVYPQNKGKNVFDLYKRKKTELHITSKIQDLVEKYTSKLKINCRKKSSIKDRISFETYLFELISNYAYSIESIVQQLSRRIYEDAKANRSRTRTKRLWEQLNDELEKYRNKKQFNYNIVAPSIYSSNYEITFTSYDGKEVHFDYLSSGEKIVFELVCYYFLSSNNNKNLEMIILDEFDANLNPALAEMYLSIVKEQFCNRGIIALLTTHSPSTVVEVEPKDLFSVSLEDDKQIITCAKNEEGKKLILRQLAPKFVYYGEFGCLEYILTDTKNVIVFTEGKEDCINFKLFKDSYTFINCNGAGNVKNFINCLNAIPFLQEGIKRKTIIALFDFDSEGREAIQNILDGAKNDSFGLKINKKTSLYIQDKKNIFLAMMVPPPDHEYDFVKYAYRHQELRKEGEIGIKRQVKLIQEIIEFHQNCNIK